MKNLVVEVPSVKDPIKLCPGFEKKLLAEWKIDIVGLCGFGCVYCSSNNGNYLRVNRKLFADLTEKQLGIRRLPNADPALTFIWPELEERLREQLATKKPTWGKGKTLVFSMLTDGFSPLQVSSGLTERVLRLILEHTAFHIRVLTKNAIVGTPKWVEFFKAYPGRFVVGLSTGTLDDAWAARVEIGTSSPSARLRALRALQDAGVPTYGMLCPVFPDVIEAGRLEELVDLVRPQLVEHLWSEPYNDRSNWATVRASYEAGSAGYRWLTAAFEEGSDAAWSRCATDLYVRLQNKAVKEGWLDKLRYLLYEDRIVAADAGAFRDLKGVLPQSKPGEDGFSQNPHIAELQREARCVPAVEVIEIDEATELVEAADEVESEDEVVVAAWTADLAAAWAAKAAPHCVQAVRILALGGTAMTTEALNAIVFASAKGPLLGGLQAWATRQRLPHPLVQTASGAYSFQSEAVRAVFAEALLQAGAA